MTKLSSPQFRAFVSVLRGYMHDLETAGPRESLSKQLALQGMLKSFEAVEPARSNNELTATRAALLVEAQRLITVKAAGRQETLTLVRLDPKPVPAPVNGPGSYTLMGDRYVSWEHLMST